LFTSLHPIEYFIKNPPTQVASRTDFYLLRQTYEKEYRNVLKELGYNKYQGHLRKKKNIGSDKKSLKEKRTRLNNAGRL